MTTGVFFLQRYCICLVLLLSSFLFGCTSLVTSTLISPSIESMQQQTDLDLVCEGAPAYLLMVDSLLARNPDNSSLLLVGSQTYAAYIAALQECGSSPERILAISEKAQRYGQALVAKHIPAADQQKLDLLQQKLAGLSTADVPEMYWGAFAWLSWIMQQKGAANAMTDLVTVEKVLQRVLQLDEGYQNSGALLFFGAYNATRPAMLGGNPELAKEYFEKALHNTNRRFLLIQVTYAETYARQTLDKELHDRLLQEVLAFPLASAPDRALSNQIAKRKARRLLADSYFDE